ncbi:MULTISPECIES: hypothetical protein [Acidiphilium]|uniref:Uncharacterized protein n=1 Tax=Acidiphilium rubrum TaxID=526 RepID=A0A8G2CMR3_ACIRU|nr:MULTISPECIES: hypothetical protein [Acidiphilium]SIR29563.1 hypothetical protein SAMN05421828_12331 [Acidiphilium rubrum]
MARLQHLIPSVCRPAHPAALDREDAGTRLSVIADARGVCAICQASGGWLDLYFIDSDAMNFERGNLVAACPLCRACQGLHRSHAAVEFLPVWAPEIPQCAINRLTRLLHQRLIIAGETPVIDQRHRPALDDQATRDLISTYLALANRNARLGIILGGYPPTARDLVTLFYAADPGRGICPAKLSAGLRLLPLGRYVVDGTDRYAEALGVQPPAKGEAQTNTNTETDNKTNTGTNIKTAQEAV